MRLFRAWSLVKGIAGCDQVRFNWFVAGREKPVAPFTELIKDYDSGDPEVWCDEILVNELLTGEEVAELREYLLRVHATELQVEEVQFPVPTGGLSYGVLLISGGKHFYMLADEEEYNLTMPILAQYSLDQSPAMLIPPEVQQAGIRFLSLSLEQLGFPAADPETLKDLVIRRYHQDGLCVRQRKGFTGKATD